MLIECGAYMFTHDHYIVKLLWLGQCLLKLTNAKRKQMPCPGTSFFIEQIVVIFEEMRERERERQYTLTLNFVYILYVFAHTQTLFIRISWSLVCFLLLNHQRVYSNVWEKLRIEVEITKSCDSNFISIQPATKSGFSLLLFLHHSTGECITQNFIYYYGQTRSYASFKDAINIHPMRCRWPIIIAVLCSIYSYVRDLSETIMLEL